MKIVHLGYAHKSDDIRIFKKECQSLIKKGHEVYFITSDKNSQGVKSKVDSGVHVIVLERTKSKRIKRYYEYLKKMTGVALSLDADVYHIHETGLIPIWKKLKKNNKLIVYDAHEDTPRQMRPQIEQKKGAIAGVLFERVLESYENYVVRKVDFVVTATPHICERFLKVKKQVICVNNYPLLHDLDYQKNNEGKRNNSICFTGGISEISGITETVKALSQVPEICFKLAGPMDEKFQKSLQKYEGWAKTNYYGIVSRDKVAEICRESFAGIILYQPLPNHINAQPNKMFEYMLMGLPIICSDFPLWRDMVESKECGICVNPESPKEIAEAIKVLYEKTELAEKMGKNGQKAVLEEYNWEKEERKLFEVYKVLEGKMNGYKK